MVARRPTGPDSGQVSHHTRQRPLTTLGSGQILSRVAARYYARYVVARDWSSITLRSGQVTGNG